MKKGKNKVLKVLMVIALLLLICLTTVLISRNRHKTAEDYLKEGDVWTEKCNFAKAIESYTKAIKVNPKLSEAYWKRSMAYLHWRDGKFDKALEDCNKVIEMYPKSAEAYYQRAYIVSLVNPSPGRKKIENKTYIEIIQDLDKAIQLDPKYELAYRFRARIFRDMKQYDKIIHDYGKFLASDPENVQKYYERGCFYYDLWNYPAARKDMEKILNLNPKGDTGKYAQYAQNLLKRLKELEKHNNGKLIDMSPLSLAIIKGDLEQVKILLDKHRNFVNPGNRQATPLHLAAEHGQRSITTLLISKGADVNAKNEENKTPLDYAQKEMHWGVIDLLRKHGAK